MPQRLNIIDFLKGFSITMIVLMHLIQDYQLPGYAYQAASFMGAGVHVFILCSGFGLYASYLRHQTDYVTFLRRRFVKVYAPMAWACLLIGAWMLFKGEKVLMPLLSNLLMFKMFVPSLECSMGGQMWFISTIFQFYFCWPLILWLYRRKGGFWISIAISLAWATFVMAIGQEEERVWSSFFLQYLWEFVLGMKLAGMIHKDPNSLTIPSLKWLIPVSILGVALTGVMGIMGQPWKQYNDIPALIGFGGCALIVYKLGIKYVNDLFIKLNASSYELYLQHLLAFDVVLFFVSDFSLPAWATFLLRLSAAYLLAWAFYRTRKHFSANSIKVSA